MMIDWLLVVVAGCWLRLLVLVVVVVLVLVVVVVVGAVFVAVAADGPWLIPHLGVAGCNLYRSRDLPNLR